MYIDYEAVRRNCPIDEIPYLFDTIPGARKWPIRADCARPDTIDYMKRHGFPKMQESQKGKNSIEDGVEFLKSCDIIIHPRCVHTSDEFATYSYEVDKKTQTVLPKIKDENNHAIDAVRYAFEGERLGHKGVIGRITPDMMRWSTRRVYRPHRV